MNNKIPVIIRILTVLLILVVVFWTGVAVGWRKAEFSRGLSDNYYRSFGNREPIGGHGAAGKVITISLPTVIVSDANGIEKTILIGADTVVRGGRADIASTTLTDNDFIVVIGSPDGKGHIMAKLIRVLPPPDMRSATTSSQ